ncbi:MAG: FecR family protein [Spirochaetales bacterium]|jgi:hypothetical protein|nr:FecR family protein [Spirochaetales bacterium]
MADKKRNVTLILFLLIFIAAGTVEAQVAQGLPSAILVYADDEFEVEITQNGGASLDAYMGMELLPGDVIRTLRSTAELRLQPNSSIIKLGENTTFRFDGFQSNSQTANDFTLLGGKVRTVAARNSRSPSNYNIYTQSAVCGVRGTDFLVGDNGRLVVAEGSVLFTRRDSNQAIQVETGMAADLSAPVFAPQPLSASQLAQEMQSFTFANLNPAEVPREDPIQTAAAEPAEEEGEAPEEAPPEETGEGETPAQDTELARADIPAFDPAPQDDWSRSSSGDAPMPDFLAKILNTLGMEIGSVTMEGQTYAKLILQPTFKIGPLELSLYAPIIYTDDIFDPSQYYRPAGNNEWSFGTDQNNVLDTIADFSRDFFLKIRYIKWGEMRDPFYLKVGNLNDLTLGHGILMYNYANDTDFPAVRKVGLNLGFNGSTRTLEFMSDNLARPHIFGARIALGGKLRMGFSGVADIDPFQGFNDNSTYDTLRDQDPMMLNFALDLEFPFFENSFFSLVSFADAATLMPVLDGKVETRYFYSSGSSGFLNNFRNYGFDAGFFGRIAGLRYRLEYIYERGVYRNGYYGPNYDRMSAVYLSDVITNYDSTVPTSYTHGIFGSLTMNLFNFIEFTGGYKWPWGPNGMDFDNDQLRLTVNLLPDKLPILGIYGSISYERTNLVGSLIDRNFEFIDANTVLRGEVVIPVSPLLDVGILIGTASQRDGQGNVILDPVTGRPKTQYTFTLDSRISF